MLSRKHHVSWAGNPCQYEQAVRADAPRALDIGIQPVADHERAPRPRPDHGLGVQWRLRLARDDGMAPGGGHDDLHKRAIAWLAPSLRGHGGVGIRRDEQGAGLDGERALREKCVADVGRVSLNDRGRGVRGHGDRPEAALPQRDPETGSPDHEDGRARRQPVRDQAGGGLRGGHDVPRTGCDAEPGQLSRDGGRGAVGVVRDEGEPHARRRRFAQRLRRAGNRGAPEVDHPVEIKEGDIVCLAQRVPACARNQGLHGRRAKRAHWGTHSPSSARSAP